MTGLDIWTASACLVAALAFGVRRAMLHPALDTWAGAPPIVQAASSIVAIAMGMTFLSIVGGAHATWREAVIYGVVAIYALVLAINLHNSGRVDEGVAR